MFDVGVLAGQIDSVLALRPRMIVSPASRAANFAKDRTRDIPVLFVSLGDPVSLGLLANPDRPDGNATGFTYRMYDYRKLFEVTSEAVGPKATGCLLVDRLWMALPRYKELTLDIEKSLGLKVLVIAEDDVEAALAQIRKLRVDAWIVPDTAMARKGGGKLAGALLSRGGVVVTELESIFSGGAHVLVAPDIERPMQTLAEMASQILKGVPIAQLPVTRPKRWTLQLNMAAIKKGPPAKWDKLLRRADKFLHAPP